MEFCVSKSLNIFLSVLVTLLLIVSPISAKYLLNSVAIMALSVIFSESGRRGLVLVLLSAWFKMFFFHVIVSGNKAVREV